MIKHKNERGISLIVLVITIIVVIILAAAVILTINKNNPIESAKKATFLSNVDTFKSELGMYLSNEFLKRSGDFDPTKLDADGSKIKYDDKVIDDGKTVSDVITSLKSSKYNNGDFVVIGGSL